MQQGARRQPRHDCGLRVMGDSPDVAAELGGGATAGVMLPDWADAGLSRSLRPRRPRIGLRIGWGVEASASFHKMLRRLVLRLCEKTLRKHRDLEAETPEAVSLEAETLESEALGRTGVVILRST